MAEHISLVKNNIKSSSPYGEYFTKAVSQGDIPLDEIGKEICNFVPLFFVHKKIIRNFAGDKTNYKQTINEEDTNHISCLYGY